MILSNVRLFNGNALIGSLKVDSKLESAGSNLGSRDPIAFLKYTTRPLQVGTTAIAPPVLIPCEDLSVNLVLLQVLTLTVNLHCLDSLCWFYYLV